MRKTPRTRGHSFGSSMSSTTRGYSISISTLWGPLPNLQEKECHLRYSSGFRHNIWKISSSPSVHSPRISCIQLIRSGNTVHNNEAIEQSHKNIGSTRSEKIELSMKEISCQAMNTSHDFFLLTTGENVLFQPQQEQTTTNSNSPLFHLNTTLPPHSTFQPINLIPKHILPLLHIPLQLLHRLNPLLSLDTSPWSSPRNR